MQITLNDDSLALICNGLRIACEEYAKHAGDAHDCGLNPVAAARLSEQFEKQRIDTLALIEKLEP